MPSNRLRLIVKTVLATVIVLGAGAALVGFTVLKAGWYNVAATQPHYQFVYSLLEQGMHESVRFHARNVPEPPPSSDARVLRGAGVFNNHCVQCHGAPGVPMAAFGQSMQPAPGPLVDAARRWTPRQMYWITRHGIRMAGMPAWEFQLPDDDIWAIVAFLEKLPMQTTASYQALVAAAQNVDDAPAPTPVPANPDPQRGRTALAQYACQSCHVIPGVTGSQTFVGPPLEGLEQRKYIAGVLPTTRDNLVHWIRAPQSVDPQTTMPAVGVSERDARDMAAYLLKQE